MLCLSKCYDYLNAMPIYILSQFKCNAYLNAMTMLLYAYAYLYAMPI